MAVSQSVQGPKEKGIDTKFSAVSSGHEGIHLPSGRTVVLKARGFGNPEAFHLSE
jgi:hypothetical protein